MFLKVKIKCSCDCVYIVDENISTTTISCPNCGEKHPCSDKLISMLKLAKEIPDGNFFSTTEYAAKVISSSEDMSIRQ